MQYYPCCVFYTSDSNDWSLGSAPTASHLTLPVYSSLKHNPATDQLCFSHRISLINLTEPILAGLYPPCGCLPSPCGKVCSSGWTGRACRDARVCLIPVSVRWPCWPPPTVRHPASSWRSHTRLSPAADSRHCSVLQGRQEREWHCGGFNLHYVQDDLKDLYGVKNISSKNVGHLHFSFLTSTLVFHLTCLHPSLTLSLRLMADTKVCSAAKSRVNLGLKLHGCLYETLIYPLREAGRWELEGYRAHKQHVPAFVWVLVSCS